MRADELRRIWREFFTEHDHVTVPSASLIPTHPSAPMFTNSGMMQFVPYFLKEEDPPFARAESIQKCVRLAGKHNDLDELGRTRRHLSFFEMLGNWSFGDYFKEEAIRWSWELVVDRVGFDGDRIWATVHDTDDDAEAIWHEVIGLPMDRIQRMGQDNFWEMGATGPCGPCSELHYDSGPQWGEEGGPKHGGGDRYVEFWNLVFMSMFRAEDGSLSDLPENNVDTGAGLERLLMLLEDVPTVFDTDAVRPLIEVVESISGKRYGADEKLDVPLRVVADHARTMAFLVADGVVPTNEDRGYVLRSVIRRTITRGQQLGIDRPFLTEVVQRTIDHMAVAYPELVDSADETLATIEREEGRFRQTLAAGSALLEQELAKGVVDGEAAFKLHDTYGFPIEITQEIADERGITVDRAGFDSAMEQQRQQSKSAQKRTVIDKEVLETYRAIVEEHGTTEFTGREEYESKATVIAVLSNTDDGTVEVFLDRTPFYAESGGQVGDTGRITTPTGTVEVLDTTYAIPGLHRHTGRIVDGDAVTEGQEATATIDAERRDAIRRNHTGTHILHWALREVLGSHVKQQGSLVAPDYLRFDFSHHEGLTPEQLTTVEDLANREVLANDSVRHYETTKEHATELGAIAFFGDKYGDIVRVLEAGRHSVELCGGTHVRATGDIGPVKIVNEGSIGSNQRRIFATTGMTTLERVRDEEERLARAAALVGTTPEEVVDGIERLRDQLKSLQDEVKALKRQAAGAGADELLAAAIDGVVVARQDGLDRDGLRELAVAVRDKGARAVVLIGEPDTGGVALVAAAQKGSGLDAKALLQDAAKAVGGGGGGKPDLATAGGKDASQIDVAVDLAKAAAGLTPPGA